MDLFAIWYEQEHGTSPTDASEGYINPAAMDDWVADSIEMREQMKTGAFE